MRTPCLLLAGALALASCGELAPSPDASTRATAAQSSAPAVAVKPPPASAQTPAPLPALTSEGWGPLRIGMTLTEVTAALGPDAEPDAVGGPEPERCDQFRPQRAPKGLLAMVEDGRLTRLSLIAGSALKTDRGFGIGAASDAVRSAYGRAALVTAHKYEDAPAAYITVWAAHPPTGEYNDNPRARGIVYEINATGCVGAIHAGGPSIQYVEGCS